MCSGSGGRSTLGLSTRTNEDGARQLATELAPLGYSVECVRTSGCLHLKSAVTAVDSNRVLCNPAWIDPSGFERVGVHVMHVDPAEPHAANVLRIGQTIVCAASHPRTTSALRALGYSVCEVEVSELAKAEAGVTCCSVIIDSYQLSALSFQPRTLRRSSNRLELGSERVSSSLRAES